MHISQQEMLMYKKLFRVLRQKKLLKYECVLLRCRPCLIHEHIRKYQFQSSRALSSSE